MEIAWTTFIYELECIKKLPRSFFFFDASQLVNKSISRALSIE